MHMIKASVPWSANAGSVRVTRAAGGVLALPQVELSAPTAATFWPELWARGSP
ncbi:hypothetical protein ACIQJT_37490 [Streptomyces sp. NPDC091972]|uniref:hypothetical protein n=1 Tax=Streptomyces sp. NPDC091972 TaxID=3366007 RepID=UPI00380892FD